MSTTPTPFGSSPAQPQATAASTAENIAQTLARELPQASIVHHDDDHPEVLHIALPKGQTLQTIDMEQLLDAPRRTKAAATLSDPTSFLEYVGRHATERTAAWCEFNPQSFSLKFSAVIDEHHYSAPGWRNHTASFTPDMSAEWKAWKGKNGQAMGQVEFAEWIENHADDITTAEGLPTSMQMLQMATEFVARQDTVLKSAVRLQSGGVNLTYIADPDSGTTESMKLFERFGIGIPVFHGGAAWQITCRLKYRIQQGKVIFFYELVRPDTVHKAASQDLIKQVNDGLDTVPMLMGHCS